MIKPAKDKAHIFSNLPNMEDVITGWFQPLTFVKITESIVDGEVVETETEFSFEGVKQPLEAEKLEIKPEGQRDWRWYQIHSSTNLELLEDDKIVIDGLPYRVMGKWDYPEYGFWEYHIIKGYEESYE